MKIRDITHQCVMLSNEVEKEFSGKLWSCSVCKDAAGVMKGYSRRENLMNKAKFHQWKPSCKLFLADLLPDTKKHWGKNMDYQRSNYEKSEEFVYARPTELRGKRQKKAQVPLPEVSEVSPVDGNTMGPFQGQSCKLCVSTEHRCISCKEKCCALCKVSGELNRHLCKSCSLSANVPSDGSASVPDKGNR